MFQEQTAEIARLRARVSELEAERDEYKQCASVEASARREFLARVAELEEQLSLRSLRE